MEIMVLYVVLSICVGIWAENRGRSGFGYCGLSLLLSPFLGFIIVAVIGKHQPGLEKAALRSGKMQKCYYCAELIRADATICKHCGNKVIP